MEKIRDGESQKREDAGARKVWKLRNAVFFPMFCGFGGLKSRLAKAASAEVARQMRDEKLHAVVAPSTFSSQSRQGTPCSDHFWKLRCWKVRAVVARSTFGIKKCQSTSVLDHFWKLRCWKTACHCGANCVWKKECQTGRVRTTFGSWDVEKVHAAVARSTFGSKKCQNTSGSDDIWKLRRRKSSRRWGAKHIWHHNVKISTRSDLFWKWRGRKSARRCREKHIWKSKVLKPAGFEPFLVCQMSFCWQIDGYL